MKATKKATDSKRGRITRQILNQVVGGQLTGVSRANILDGLSKKQRSGTAKRLG